MREPPAARSAPLKFMSTPVRWERIDALFGSLVAMPPEQREAWLDAPGLRGEPEGWVCPLTRLPGGIDPGGIHRGQSDEGD